MLRGTFGDTDFRPKYAIIRGVDIITTDFNDIIYRVVTTLRDGFGTRKAIY